MAECLPRHAKRPITLVLIGDGQEREAVEAYVRDRRLENVRFLGVMPKTEVAAWLRHARCALLSFRPVPVLDTVSPNKLFDAFAAGVPVVQTTQGWIKTLLAREECGITVAPDNPGAMAEAVEQLASDLELHDRLAANARRVAREQFDRDMVAGRYREILESVVATHG
jgi:glycosyltransferase involved in cell wall biosynthesis